MHFALNIFIVFLVLIVGWLLFFAWLVGLVFRTLWTVLSRLTGMGNRPWPARPNTQRCAGLRCGAPNPASANFCRRCGASLNRSAVKRQIFSSATRRPWASSPFSQ